jgi:hypothetical protein
MVRVIRIAEDGTEKESVEIDDFTIEVVYSGISDMLRAAATSEEQEIAASLDLPRDARQRREKVLTRIGR